MILFRSRHERRWQGVRNLKPCQVVIVRQGANRRLSLSNMSRNRKFKIKAVEETTQAANETGILKDAMPRLSLVEEGEELSFGDEIFNAVILIIPFSFLLLMFEM